MKRFLMSLALAGALIFGTSTQQQAEAQPDQILGTVIGAVGGGLLGSTIGAGDGRVVATAAGTIIGAAIGHEVTSNNNDYYDYDRPRRRVVERETVVYREVQPRTKVVYVEKERPRKKWKRVAKYDDGVLVCNKRGKRCKWYD